MGRGAKPASKTSENVLQEYETKITDALRELHENVINSHEKKEKFDEILHSIESIYDKIRSDNRMTNYHKSKLKTLYPNALKEAQSEAEILRKSLAEIAQIRKLRTEKRHATRKGAVGDTPGAERTRAPIRRGTLMVMLQQSANTLPLWIGKLGESPPPLCGAVPPDDCGYICKQGDAVAALVKGDEDEQNWILAEVVCFHTINTRYEVEDVDEEQKGRHVLAKKKIIPLPLMRANPETDHDALFPLEAVVLALYPQTTCFYKGVVEQVPTAPTDDYLIAFEDSSYPNGYSPPLPVPQRYVVVYRDTTK